MLESTLASLTCTGSLGDLKFPLDCVTNMYDTSPLTPFKGEIKPFVQVDIDNKTLESLFDLHPSLENSLDLNELVSGAVVPGAAVDNPPVSQLGQPATSPLGVPASAPVSSHSGTSAVDLVTLSSAATSQALAEIERQQAGTASATRMARSLE